MADQALTSTDLQRSAESPIGVISDRGFLLSTISHRLSLLTRTCRNARSSGAMPSGRCGVRGLQRIHLEERERQAARASYCAPPTNGVSVPHPRSSGTQRPRWPPVRCDVGKNVARNQGLVWDAGPHWFDPSAVEGISASSLISHFPQLGPSSFTTLVRQTSAAQ